MAITRRFSAQLLIFCSALICLATVLKYSSYILELTTITEKTSNSFNRSKTEGDESLQTNLIANAEHKTETTNNSFNRSETERDESLQTDLIVNAEHKTEKTSNLLNRSETEGDESLQTDLIANAEEQNLTKRIPFIIGAGLGTTGTHFVAKATCQLRYPSIHYNLGCIPPKNELADLLHKNVTQEIPEIYLSAYKHYKPLINKIQGVAKLIKKGGDKSAREWYGEMINSLRDFIEFIADSMVDFPPLALHDYPWPSLLPTMLKESKIIYGRKWNVTKLLPPVILLSERDPLEYAERRVSTHGSLDVICKEKFIAPMNPQTLTGGAFDVLGCIENALKGLSINETNKIGLKDIFITMNAMDVEYGGLGRNNTLEKEPSKGIIMIAQYVKEYQDTVRGKADFSYNLFAHQNKTTLEDLTALMLSEAEEIRRYKENIDSGKQQQQPYVNVNYWKKKKQNWRKRRLMPSF